MMVDEVVEFHVPVLLNEVVYWLQIASGSWYVDATVGGGGHTAAILNHGGRVLALDQDEDALARLRKRFEIELKEEKLKILKTNFAHLQAAVDETKVKSIKGILFDLGMSTYQIKRSGRGFSFRSDEPLDMRMDQDLPETAADIVNTRSQDNLYEIFHKFGEEHLARKLAIAISRARAIGPIKTTGVLQRIAAEVYRKAGVREKIDPATRMFQALRITVNDELENLRTALPQAIQVLEKDGRLAVISFHSLEDRIVKQLFLDRERKNEIKIMTKKPITAGLKETEENPASRSAKLRVIQKL